MEKQSEYREQLSEIHAIINESRFKMVGGGMIALVWGVLTATAIAIGILVPSLGHRMTYVWAAHNVLGWSFSLITFQRAAKREGCVSAGGLNILRVWALWTVAIWLVSFVLQASQVYSGIAYAGCMTLLVGLGIFVTGLVGNDRLTQTLGTAAVIIGPGLAILAPRGQSVLLSFGSIVAIIIAWGIGSWVAGKR